MPEKSSGQMNVTQQSNHPEPPKNVLDKLRRIGYFSGMLDDHENQSHYNKQLQ